MVEYIYINGKTLERLRLERTTEALIDEGNSLMTLEVWQSLCKESGGEERLMAELGITEVTNGATDTTRIS